ncbi:MAG: substrate-binding domain-containing protein [Candidatus Bathyarchaeota archaeon]|jgi:tungstate transport system substrate-binding protein|nr:substrate-binding domain-containing protein [Candidatus Bathyarchaeota archaeon]
MHLWKKLVIVAILATIVVIAGTIFYFGYFAKRRLFISTTTSLYDIGLLDMTEKDYESTHNVDLQIIAAGTGIAIQHAKNGDADVILVHSPPMEKTFLEEGYGVNRKIIAYNFFTIVGPENDPARISGKNATEALKSIVAYGDSLPDQSGATKIWISRGDNSGTHSKEQSLWKAAGFNYTLISQKPWYASTGSGMGDALNAADQKSAYTLSDMGTYLKFYKDGIISLKALITEDVSLLNVYSAIAVKPDVPANKSIHEQINFKDAMDFIQYLVSPETQQLITNYGRDAYGQSLFFGAVKPLKNNEQPIAGWIRDYAYINGYECPPQYRSGYDELYTYG